MMARVREIVAEAQAGLAAPFKRLGVSARDTAPSSDLEVQPAIFGRPADGVLHRPFRLVFPPVIELLDGHRLIPARHLPWRMLVCHGTEEQ